MIKVILNLYSDKFITERFLYSSNLVRAEGNQYVQEHIGKGDLHPPISLESARFSGQGMVQLIEVSSSQEGHP